MLKYFCELTINYSKSNFTTFCSYTMGFSNDFAFRIILINNCRWNTRPAFIYQWVVFAGQIPGLRSKTALEIMAFGPKLAIFTRFSSQYTWWKRTIFCEKRIFTIFDFCCCRSRNCFWLFRLLFHVDIIFVVSNHIRNFMSPYIWVWPLVYSFFEKGMSAEECKLPS